MIAEPGSAAADNGGEGGAERTAEAMRKESAMPPMKPSVEEKRAEDDEGHSERTPGDQAAGSARQERAGGRSRPIRRGSGRPR